jgi:hypothetical protein
MKDWVGDQEEEPIAHAQSKQDECYNQANQDQAILWRKSPHALL